MGVGAGVGAGLELIVGDGVTVGVAAAVEVLLGTPLFQTNLPPFLMQVNFLPAALFTWPSFLHTAPGFTATDEIAG